MDSNAGDERMIDTDKYEGEIIDEREIDLPSLMIYMAFNRPEELSAVKQAIHSHKCDVETVRWAVNWWHTNWGGIDPDALEYLGIGDEE